MLSRNIRRFTPQVSKHFTGSRSYSSFDRDFQLLANAMTRDFDRSFSRSVDPWNFFGPRSSFFSEPVYYQPIRSTYEKKTITNDENGNVVVKTMRKTPGRPWETYVEEYVNDKSLEQGKKPEALDQSSNSKVTNQAAKDEAASQQHNKEQSEASPSTEQQDQTVQKTNSQAGQADRATTNQKQTSKDQTHLQQSQNQQSMTRHSGGDMFSVFDRHFQELSDSMTRDFDRFFGNRSSFGGWNVFEPERMSFDPEQTSYRLKTVVNDNGNVTVKTVVKNPGSEWETSVKEYSLDNAVDGGKKAEAIGETSKNEQKAAEKIEGDLKNDQASSSGDQNASQ